MYTFIKLIPYFMEVVITYIVVAGVPFNVARMDGSLKNPEIIEKARIFFSHTSSVVQ